MSSFLNVEPFTHEHVNAFFGPFFSGSIEDIQKKRYDEYKKAKKNVEKADDIMERIRIMMIVKKETLIR